MKNKNEIGAILGAVRGRVSDSLSTLLQNHKVDLSGGVDNSVDCINKFLNAVSNVIKGESYYIDGVDIPDFLKSWRFYSESDKLVYIDLSVRTKLGVVPVVKESATIYVGDTFEQEIVSLFTDAVLGILANELAKENIESLNLELGKLILSSGYIPEFDFSFVLSNDSIVEISDNEVTLGVSLEKAFNVSELAIFTEAGEGNTYLEYCIQTARNNFIESLKGVQNPVGLLKASIEIIDDLCNLKTKKRVDSLLRQVYHKQAKCFGSTKSGIGYISEKVNIEGEEKNIFALVKKDGDKLEVVLSPFDVKSLDKVDFDVLSLLA